MPTIKQRINITADSDIGIALRMTAKRDNVPVATKAAELLHLGLELEEDFALATIARSRDTSKVKYIPHAKAWK